MVVVVQFARVVVVLRVVDGFAGAVGCWLSGVVVWVLSCQSLVCLDCLSVCVDGLILGRLDHLLVVCSSRHVMQAGLHLRVVAVGIDLGHLCLLRLEHSPSKLDHPIESSNHQVAAQPKHCKLLPHI